MSLLEVRGLRKSFGGVHAVQGVSLGLAAGEVLALIGPNGAGKTTTFQMLGGQLAPDAGRVRLGGREVTGLAPRALARLGVGRTFQIAETFTSFTALANVQMALLAHDARHWRFWRRADGYRPQDARALLAQVGMAEQADRPCSELAYGDVKRLELALALAGEPRLLLMDEPTAGMAPAERVALMQLARTLAKERRIAVLFTEHSMDVVFGQADRIAVMVRGELLAEGPPEAIREDARVQEAYLGTPQHQNESGSRLPSKGLRPETHEKSPVEAEPLLAVRGLHAWYGAAHILHGVSLSVRPGEVVALMGRNGAGKSTTLKSIAGLLARTEGERRFMGQEISRWPAHRIARAGLGYVPEERRIFGDLTVLQNLETGRQPPRAWPGGAPVAEWTVERLFALFPNLREMPDRLGARMSGGEQQMLTVARTLMGQPYLLLLDEPSEGVAPVIVQQMGEALRALKAQGLAIVLSEQNLAFAQAVADRVVVIEQGRLVHEALMAELAADAQARRRFLGVT
ncbi:MAG: ATP-binding cassette domain-containing protein [Comamonadaceae bacterium]|nr:ATP-binding cassette domain-containing protein [Comamonadaceae bacterium]